MTYKLHTMYLIIYRVILKSTCIILTVYRNIQNYTEMHSREREGDDNELTLPVSSIGALVCREWAGETERRA